MRFRDLFLYPRAFINVLELAFIMLTMTACPPPPDDEVPVRPPYSEPARPVSS